MDVLEKVEKYADRIAGFLIVIIFSIMIISCILQVYTRYVLNDSLSWTEELARYTFIWANLLAASFCVKNNSHAKVTAIFDLFPSGIQKYMNFVIQILIMIMAGVMINQGIKMLLVTKTQLSPAIGMNMSLVYLAIPVSGVFIIFYSLINLIKTAVSKGVRGAND